MAEIFIALGGNLGDRSAMMASALRRLSKIMEVTNRSEVYETAAKYVTDQPSFLNMVLSGRTDLSPDSLLDSLKMIEIAMGRVEGRRFGPRPIDLDILFYDSMQIETQNLTVPHPRLQERRFVLQPLADIAPELCHPVSGLSVAEMLAALPLDDDVRRV